MAWNPCGSDESNCSGVYRSMSVIQSDLLFYVSNGRHSLPSETFQNVPSLAALIPAPNSPLSVDKVKVSTFSSTVTMS